MNVVINWFFFEMYEKTIKIWNYFEEYLKKKNFKHTFYVSNKYVNLIILLNLKLSSNIKLKKNHNSLNPNRF